MKPEATSPADRLVIFTKLAEKNELLTEAQIARLKEPVVQPEDVKAAEQALANATTQFGADSDLAYDMGVLVELVRQKAGGDALSKAATKATQGIAQVLDQK